MIATSCRRWTISAPCVPAATPVCGSRKTTACRYSVVPLDSGPHVAPSVVLRIVPPAPTTIPVEALTKSTSIRSTSVILLAVLGLRSVHTPSTARALGAEAQQDRGERSGDGAQDERPALWWIESVGRHSDRPACGGDFGYFITARRRIQRRGGIRNPKYMISCALRVPKS